MSTYYGPHESERATIQLEYNFVRPAHPTLEHSVNRCAAGGRRGSRYRSWSPISAIHDMRALSLEAQGVRSATVDSPGVHDLHAIY